LTNPDPILTQRLSLIPLDLSDLKSIYQIAREKRSIEDFQYAAHTVEDVRAWLEPSFHDPDTLQWVIRKEGKVIGLFEVCLEAEYSDLSNGVCRIGYFLDWREHGRGYATEALLGAIEWLFCNTDVERIEAGVTLHNVASYRILEKAGFIRDKVIKGNWKWHDQVYDSAYYFLQKPVDSRQTNPGIICE
jgi:RimJ/RimL family protein N-acetyltransferase